MDADDLPTPIERFGRPFQTFARFKGAGAVLLLLASTAALVWANSGLGDRYRELLGMKLTVGVEAFSLSKPILLWINDGLMGIFFFIVGLEIKREVLAGELASMRRAMLPIVAAVGGMVVPAGVFAALNYGGEGAHGWGIPMATDIAFALGVLLILGPRVPIGLKVFLTALAIVDDLGAIVVIAVFYSHGIAVTSLVIGLVLLVVSVFANVVGVRNALVYFVIGTLVWLAFLKSGVHATLASVLMALTIPAKTRIRAHRFHDRMAELLAAFRATDPQRERGLLSSEQQHLLHRMEQSVDHVSAPLQQLEHSLNPLVTFVVLPIFALANAGVALSGGVQEALRDPICLGVLLGLLFGKPIGVVGAAWIAVRAGVADLPKGVNWGQMVAVGFLAGIGFTMSLFIGSLAYTRPEFVQLAKVGILVASAVASVVGGVLLRRSLPSASVESTVH